MHKSGQPGGGWYTANFNNYSPNNSGQHLSIDDLLTVFHALYDASTKWNCIGLELGMHHSDLAAIKQRHREDPYECLEDLLAGWLKRSNPKPTWEAVVKALESRIVGFEQLAESIKEKYLVPINTECNTTQSVNGHQPLNGSNSEHFHCPCGQCGLLSYLDKGCPKSNSSQYPYLELNELDEDDKEDLLQKLSDDTASIIKSFANLLSTTSESLNDRNIEVDKLIKVALDLGAFKSDKNQLPLLGEDRHQLLQAKSIDRAFITLGEHMSFFNYEILSHIIEHLGSEEDKDNLAKYCSQFKTFCERKVFEVPPSVFYPSGQKRKNRKLFVVIGTEDLFRNLSDVKAAQRKIASLLGLTVSTLQLKRIDLASIIIVFSIPASVGHHLSFDSSTVNSLTSFGFTLVIPDLYNITPTDQESAEDTVDRMSVLSEDEIDQISVSSPDESDQLSLDKIDQISVLSLGIVSNDSGFLSRSSSQMTLNSLWTPTTRTSLDIHKGHSAMNPQFSPLDHVPNQIQCRSEPSTYLRTALMSSTSSDNSPLPAQRLTRADQLNILVSSFRRKNKKIGVFYDTKQKQKADIIVRRLNELLSGGVCVVHGFEILPLMSDWLQRALLGGVHYFIFVGLPPRTTFSDIQRLQLRNTISETAFFDIRKYKQRVAEVVVVLSEQQESRYHRTPHYLDKFLPLENGNMDKVAEDALALFAGEFK